MYLFVRTAFSAVRPAAGKKRPKGEGTPGRFSALSPLKAGGNAAAGLKLFVFFPIVWYNE